MTIMIIMMQQHDYMMMHHDDGSWWCTRMIIMVHYHINNEYECIEYEYFFYVNWVLYSAHESIMYSTPEKHRVVSACRLIISGYPIRYTSSMSSVCWPAPEKHQVFTSWIASSGIRLQTHPQWLSNRLFNSLLNSPLNILLRRLLNSLLIWKPVELNRLWIYWIA